MTPRLHNLINQLFNAIENNDCVTRDDIRHYGGFLNVEEVSEALTTIRRPKIAKQYGWTVPHVRRGRTSAIHSNRRFIAVGLTGQVLTPQDTYTILQGLQSTQRNIAAMCRNEANSLRFSATVSPDPKNRKTCRSQATIMDGMSAQADLEGDRIDTLLAVQAAKMAATPPPSSYP